MTANKAAAAQFRAECLLALHEHGFTAATRAPEKKGGPAFDRVRGDILGVADWTIATRNQRDLALAEAADEVEREALAEGSQFWVSIQARRSRPVLDSYATMPLHVLLNLLTVLHRKPAESASV